MDEEPPKIGIVIEHNLGRAEILATKLREAYQHLVTTVEPDRARTYLSMWEENAKSGGIDLMLIGNPSGYIY